MNEQIKQLSGKIDLLISEIRGLKIQMLGLLNQPTDHISFYSDGFYSLPECAHPNAYITTGGWYCPDCGVVTPFNYETEISNSDQSPA